MARHGWAGRISRIGKLRVHGNAYFEK